MPKFHIYSTYTLGVMEGTAEGPTLCGKPITKTKKPYTSSLGRPIVVLHVGHMMNQELLSVLQIDKEDLCRSCANSKKYPLLLLACLK